MKKHMATLCLLTLAACDAAIPGDDTGPSETPAPVTETAVVAQPLEPPAGLELEGPFVRMDLGTREHLVPIRGSRARIAGVLSDSAGRRSLQWLDERGEPTSLAPTGWNLPPAAATGANGDSLACWSRLTGDDSTGMPHPAQGMELVCRLRSRGTLGPELRLAAGARAAWLQTVVALRDGGFRVVYHTDDGWLVGPAGEGHGQWSQRVGTDGPEPPTLLRAVTDPM